jgi:hypothetical protein
MLELSNNLLEASLSHALEVMAFISGASAEKTDAPEGPLLATQIRYSGAIRGGIELICPLRLGAIVACNLLGCAVDSTEALNRAPDALGELVNITCGEMLRHLVECATGIVEMATPVQRSFDCHDWSTLAESGWRFFEAEGCLIACSCINVDSFTGTD